MANQLRPGRAQRLRGAQLGRVDGAHAGRGSDGNRGEDRQVDQQHFRQLTDAAPDHDQRQVGQWRDRAVELDQRIENAAGDAVVADGNAHRDGRKNGKTQGQADSCEAGAQVLPQGGFHVAVGHQQPAPFQHRGRSWQEQGLDPASGSHTPPGQQQGDQGQRADPACAQAVLRACCNHVGSAGFAGCRNVEAAHAGSCRRAALRWENTRARTCSRVSIKRGSDLIARADSPAA
ncbi:hypothetical protein D3C85_1279480 [compost metagenome]